MGSCLGTEGSMRRAMLEVIANGSVCRPQDISSYLGCTLLFAIHDDPVRISADMLMLPQRTQFLCWPLPIPGTVQCC